MYNLFPEKHVEHPRVQMTRLCLQGYLLGARFGFFFIFGDRMV